MENSMKERIDVERHSKIRSLKDILIESGFIPLSVGPRNRLKRRAYEDHLKEQRSIVGRSVSDYLDMEIYVGEVQLARMITNIRKEISGDDRGNYYCGKTYFPRRENWTKQIDWIKFGINLLMAKDAIADSLGIPQSLRVAVGLTFGVGQEIFLFKNGKSLAEKLNVEYEKYKTWGDFMQRDKAYRVQDSVLYNM